MTKREKSPMTMDFERRNKSGRKRLHRQRPCPHYDHQEEEEEEEDAETVIVYKEASSIVPPWALSQMSVTSTRTHRSTTQREQYEKEKEEEEQHYEHEAVSNLTSRKRQRRSRSSRGRGRKSREQTFTEYESIGDDREEGNGSDSDDGVDGFASLRSMMGQLSQEQKTGLRQRQRQRQQDEGSNNSTKSQSETETETERMCGDNRTAEGFSQDSTDKNIKASLSSIKKTPPSSPAGAGNEYENEIESIGQDSNEISIPIPINDNNRKIESPTPAAENDTEGNRMSNTCERLCSPPDFDICISNDYDDDEDEYSYNNINSATMESIPSSLRVRNQNSLLDSGNKYHVDDDTSRMDHQNTRRASSERTNHTVKQRAGSVASGSSKRHNLDRHSSKRTSTASSSSATVTANRRRERPDTLSRRSFAALNSGKKQHQHQQQSSQPTQTATATNVENVKSIVGLRYVYHQTVLQDKNKKSTNSESLDNCIFV